MDDERCRYSVRGDGSIYIAFGDAGAGAHCQADCDLPERYVKLLVDAYEARRAALAQPVREGERGMVPCPYCKDGLRGRKQGERFICPTCDGEAKFRDRRAALQPAQGAEEVSAEKLAAQLLADAATGEIPPYAQTSMRSAAAVLASLPAAPVGWVADCEKIIRYAMQSGGMNYHRRVPNQNEHHCDMVDLAADVLKRLSAAPRATPDAERATVERLREALRKIAELRYVEDANEPFDDALDIADAALAALRAPLTAGQRHEGEECGR